MLSNKLQNIQRLQWVTRERILLTKIAAYLSHLPFNINLILAIVCKKGWSLLLCFIWYWCSCFYRRPNYSAFKQLSMIATAERYKATKCSKMTHVISKYKTQTNCMFSKNEPGSQVIWNTGASLRLQKPCLFILVGHAARLHSFWYVWGVCVCKNKYKNKFSFLSLFLLGPWKTFARVGSFVNMWSKGYVWMTCFSEAMWETYSIN